MIQQAVILAAGRGTRLHALTQERPKAMLPILGRPILVRVMDRLREAGVRRFTVVIGEREGEAAAYLSNSWYPDAEVSFAIQAIPTGTVDALRLAAPTVRGPFILSSVDNLTSVAHIQRLIDAFERAPKTIATLSLIPSSAEQIRQSSDVVLEGERVVAIEEKPATPRGQHAAIMLYAFAPEILRYLEDVPVSPRGERELVSAIQAAIRDGRTVNYVTAQRRLHLTREADLLTITKVFLAEGRDAHILSEIPSSTHIVPPVRIDPNVSVGQNARIGPNVYLERGATVGDGAHLENTIVLTRASVPAHAHCSEEIVTPHAHISAR